MNFPDNLFYTADHEWIKISGDEATIGITEFAQSELGDIVFVELNAVGSEVEKGAVFGTVEAVKTVSDLFMPLTGTIKEVNGDLDSSPETVNGDPYEAGWMVKVTLANPDDKEGLMSAEEYRKLVNH